LHFGRRPVDFVGQHEIGEDRTFARLERPLARHVDHGPDQVGRQQVRRELNPLEPRRQGLRQGLDRRRFGQARHAFEQNVPVRQQAHQQPGDHLLLPDDGLAQLAVQPLDQLRLLRHPVFDLIDVHTHGLAPLF